MEEEEATAAEQIRCNRTDGRDWRCNRPVREGSKLCEVHYIQARRRQRKEGVPDSLKLQRRKRRKNKALDAADLIIEKSRKIRAKNVDGVGMPKLVKLRKPVKRKRVIGESEALDEAVRKMKLKKGDPQLELIRMVLRRETEKRKKKETDFEEGDSSDSDGDLMKQLPNGVMAISSSPNLNNAGSCSGSGSSSNLCVNVKIGEAEADTATVTRRRFRSKNIEPLPFGTLKVVPFKKNVASSKRRRKKCHRCPKSGAQSLIDCSNCGRQFCADCLKEKYFLTQDEVQQACPVCRGSCGCKACKASQHNDIEHKDFLRDKNKAFGVVNLHYLMCMLLPVLKRMNQEQNTELDVEAKRKGRKASDVQIQVAEFGGYNNCCCSNCKTSIADFHRSCPKCSYKLCLSCCREFVQGSLAGSVNAILFKCQNKRKACIPGIRLSDRISISTYKPNCNGTYFESSASLLSWKGPDAGFHISCPPSDAGGCGKGRLDLRCLFPLSWIKELELNAEELVGSYDLPEALETFSCCSLCMGMDNEGVGIKKLQEAANREDSHDNFLYYPTVLDIQGDNHEHFQKHWGRGHPVIIQNVLKNNSDLSWDPVFLFCSYLQNDVAKPKNDGEETRPSSRLDWLEVEIGVKQMFLGSFRGQTHANTCDEKMKLKGWLSTRIFEEQFPTHFADTINALPLPDYMNPNSGLLNIAANGPQEIPKSDLGPCLSISYQSGEELGQPDSVTKLCYHTCDVVNILAHATDTPVSMKQLNRIRKLLKKKHSQNQKEAVKSTLEQKSSSQGENKEELQRHAENGKQSHDREIVPISSHVAAANHEAHDLDQEDGSDSDSGSDSDCNSSSEDPAAPGAIESLVCVTNDNLAKSCGAQWDVFRRQDVPKIMDYINKHSRELKRMHGSRKHVVHPILDQIFFLDTTHKARLKEEYEIEPWSFEQHVGEAVVIPAGCPYQIRNVKSCVNVELEFISPENTSESIRLNNELRLLPEDHKARSNKFEVNKMALYSISTAINEIRELTLSKNNADHS